MTWSDFLTGGVDFLNALGVMPVVTAGAVLAIAGAAYARFRAKSR